MSKRQLCFAAAAVLSAVALHAQTESAEAIMAKVAENQDRSQTARAAFIYKQNMLIRMKRGNGKIAREETREYIVTPTEKGFHKELANFTGKYEKGGKFIEYGKPGYEYKGIDIDGDLADSLANDLANEKKSRDGIATGLPLSQRQQSKYTFHLDGREKYREADVYKITFTPQKASLFDCDEDDDGACWSGEVLVDVKEYQPVLVSTFFAKGVPMWVQAVFGTNIRHLGFKVSYQRFDEGLWFPVTYGGEFEVKAVFLYKRRIAVALTNSGFQRADVTSKVQFEKP